MKIALNKKLKKGTLHESIAVIIEVQRAIFEAENELQTLRSTQIIKGQILYLN